MRIGCLQFAPQVGDVDNNINRADAILSLADQDDLYDLDLLVLPEMAFSGYNFKSLQHISEFLEPTTTGISALWARTTALKYNCLVAVGYPEKVDVSQDWPTSPRYYNSLLVVSSEDGEVIANYRKSFLYYTDETWALEGPGFFEGELPGLGTVALGICMDINPYRFEAPWHAFEFAFHVLEVKPNLVIVSMAWLTREDADAFGQYAEEPDMETVSYWIQRLEPLIRAESEGEIIVVFANRCGTEDEAVYAGTSTVIGVQNGEVCVYGLLGRGEEELLVIDTSLPPFAKLVNRPDEDLGEVAEGEPPFPEAGRDTLPSAPETVAVHQRPESNNSPQAALPPRRTNRVEEEEADAEALKAPTDDVRNPWDSLDSRLVPGGESQKASPVCASPLLVLQKSATTTPIEAKRASRLSSYFASHEALLPPTTGTKESETGTR